MLWYVINGELTDEGESSVEVARVVKGTCYEEVVANFQSRHPGVTCINADHFCEQTARSYNVPYLHKDQDITRPIFILHSF